MTAVLKMVSPRWRKRVPWEGTTLLTLSLAMAGLMVLTSRLRRDLPAHLEGHAFQQRAAEAGFRDAVRERDAAPYDDFGPSTNKG